MKLYLHIGTEKTGSSYLQTLLANNREQLQQSGICFPSAGKWEAQMQKGQISPGNGQQLYELLLQDNITAVEEHLLKLHRISLKRNGHILLISNELLVTAFARKESWETFTKVVQNIGFSNVQMLLFLRDPTDQALSLYKHRAKGGTIPEIEQWINESYHYPKSLDGLMARIDQDGLSCSFRQYRKDADYMDRALFRDWLGIKKPAMAVSKSVNPSLSISELLLLKRLKIQQEELAQEFYDQMLALPQKEKAVEYRIENYYRKVIEDYLYRYETIWKKCNKHLPEGEKLILPRQKERSGAENNLDKALVFSETQVDLIAKMMAESLTLKFRWELRKRTWRKGLRKLKANFLKKIQSS